jgi:hypothetical protein
MDFGGTYSLLHNNPFYPKENELELYFDTALQCHDLFYQTNLFPIYMIHPKVTVN